ncbi:MAG: hypothetical protein ACOVMT_13145, partial [Caulobacter sp.]
SAVAVNYKTTISHVPGIGYCQGQLNRPGNEVFFMTAKVRLAREFGGFSHVSAQRKQLGEVSTSRPLT